MLKNKELAIRTLNVLALALVGHKHQWTNKERRLYERAIASLT